MAAAAPERHEEDLDHEARKVVSWRLRQLYRAGYEFQDARAIACSDVDLHGAVEMIRKCADSRQARRIIL